MTWSNWAGDQICAPAEVVEPSSEAELVEALAGASRVRVAGSGHSFTDIALTDGLQVSLRRMDRVLDSDGSLVRVQAGIRLRELGLELARRGLAMENLGDVDAQTLAGALATGTHGTGVGYRNLSSQVEGMRLV
ncbi:MAG: L-gulono,4-lactone dehydrogenase, partial [Thermoleophilaceae bacterium]|nr:L-gulono,4-lactone dehydrogenase [Thermoleophilaceae bacterium]